MTKRYTSIHKACNHLFPCIQNQEGNSVIEEIVQTKSGAASGVGNWVHVGKKSLKGVQCFFQINGHCPMENMLPYVQCGLVFKKVRMIYNARHDM